MAMGIFILLNGVGLAFLVYVLINFWNEGHRAKSATRPFQTHFVRNDIPEVHVINFPISHSAAGGLSVMPLQAQESKSRGKQDSRPAGRAAVEIPRKRVSAR